MPDTLPLSGVRVVDFSWIIAGPTCTRILALMGAEVVKVESRRRPDPTRRGGGGNFHFLTQAKESVTLNLSTPRGLELAKGIISQSDVVVENFATGVIERLGLGYEVVRRLRPDIIMVSSAGLGHTGPDKDHVAYGTLLQCFTGWSALTGFPDKPPVIGGAWADPLNGMMQAFLVASALHHRGQTGLGQYIDLSMAEVTSSLLPEAMMDYAMNGRVTPRMGNKDALHSPCDLYPCQGNDQWVAVTVTNAAEWRALCSVIGRPDMAQNPGMTGADGRGAWSGEIDGAIRRWTQHTDKYEAMRQLQAAGVPAGPSLHGNEVFRDPHLEARGFFHTHTDSQGREVRLESLPWQFTDGPKPVNAPAPDMGQHNQLILGDLLGLSAVEIERLVQEQVAY